MRFFSRRSSSSESPSPPATTMATHSSNTFFNNNNNNASSSEGESSRKPTTNIRSPISPPLRSMGPPSPSFPSAGQTPNRLTTRRLSLAPNLTPSYTPRRRLSKISFLTGNRLGSENNDREGLHTICITPVSPSHRSSKHHLPIETYKLVVLGGPKVGKTAIVQRFLYDKFPELHAATVEELHKADYDVKGLGTVSVEILDTSGSFEFPAMKRLAITGGHAFILVYSITDKESFEEVCRLRELIIEVKKNSSRNNSAANSRRGSTVAATMSTQVPVKTEARHSREEDENSLESSSPSFEPPPIVIVANKSDLNDQREVSKEIVDCECIDWDVAFVECSAKDNDNVIRIFHQLMLQAHLKGILKGLSSSTSTVGHNLVIEPKRERRRSSLPVNELFHHHFQKLSHKSPTSPDSKRTSCTVS